VRSERERLKNEWRADVTLHEESRYGRKQRMKGKDRAWKNEGDVANRKIKTRTDYHLERRCV